MSRTWHTGRGEWDKKTGELVKPGFSWDDYYSFKRSTDPAPLRTGRNYGPEALGLHNDPRDPIRPPSTGKTNDKKLNC